MDDQYRIPDVNRLEVIDDKGRSYVNLNIKNLDISIQDNGRTLKIFTYSSYFDAIKEMYEREEKDINKFSEFVKKLLKQDV